MTWSAANVTRFRPPLGLFGGIKVEHDAEHRGQLDVKKAGIFAITEGVKALAMETGIMAGGTPQHVRGRRHRERRPAPAHSRPPSTRR